MQWQAEREPLDSGRVQRLRIRCGRIGLDFAGWLDALARDAVFRAGFNTMLADAPFAGFFWEMPGLTRADLNRPYECVVVDSPALAGMAADAAAFSGHFTERDDVAEFSSLGQDAWLVAPCPHGPREACAHLAAFVRGAPVTQQQVFWQRVAVAVQARLCDRPLWLSTSGLGVCWLHARLDSASKYYTWQPYCRR
jgi:hypothetical protein